MAINAHEGFFRLSIVVVDPFCIGTIERARSFELFVTLPQVELFMTKTVSISTFRPQNKASLFEATKRAETGLGVGVHIIKTSRCHLRPDPTKESRRQKNTRPTKILVKKTPFYISLEQGHNRNELQCKEMFPNKTFVHDMISKTLNPTTPKKLKIGFFLPSRNIWRVLTIGCSPKNVLRYPLDRRNSRTQAWQLYRDRCEN